MEKSAATLVACLLVLLLNGYGVYAQVDYPVHGQLLPPNQRTVVTVDVLFDSISSINSLGNSYVGVFWLHMYWQDDSALNAILTSTQAWVAPGGECNRPCDDTGHKTGGCCDQIWLPHIDMANLLRLDQDAYYKQRIWLAPSETGNGATNIVHWSVRVTAEFHSPFDFRAWPFEHQHLLLELQVPPALADRVTLVLNEVRFLHNTPHTKGEVVPGWYVAKITKREFDASVCYNSTPTASSSAVFTVKLDNATGLAQVGYAPLRPDGWAQVSMPDQPDIVPTTVQLTECTKSTVYGTATQTFPEALAQYNPRMLLVDIMVRRVKDYHILATIIPQMLLAYLVFITYAMDRKDLEARAMVVVTLVLAASALQFTWDFPPANYLNAVQQITVASYILYFLVAIESMLASHISRMHTRRREKAQIASALAGGPKGAAPPAQAGATSSLFAPSVNIKSAQSLSSELAQIPESRNLAYMKGGVSTNSNASYSNMSRRPPPNSSGDLEYWEPAVDRNVRGAPIGEGTEGLRTPSEEPVLENMYNSTAVGTATGIEVRGGDAQVYMRPSAVVRNKDPKVDIEMMTEESLFGTATQKGRGYSNKMSNSGKTMLGKYGRAMSMRLGHVTRGTRDLRQRVNRDEAFAQRFAARMDKFTCFFLLFGYTVTTSVLLYLNTAAGDHKLMLQGDRPANM